MAKRKKLKAAKVSPKKKSAQVHDRRAKDLPFNAKVAVVTVDDPFGIREFAAEAPAERRDYSRPMSAAATELRSPGQPKVSVIVSLRDDPLRTMFVRGRITDLQCMAGLKYRDDIDTSMLGGGRAIDYSRPAVDGGRLGDPLSDAVMAAFGRLSRADAALKASTGHGGLICARYIIGERKTVVEYGRHIGWETKHGLSRCADFLRLCLDTLAEVYGLASRRAA